MRPYRATAASGLLLLAASGIGGAQRPEPEVVSTIDGDPVYRLLPPDRIPAIRDPEFVTGREARDQMSPDEAVVGLEIREDVRAYSLWQLDAHEIVNDVVGGVPVAVTW